MAARRPTRSTGQDGQTPATRLLDALGRGDVAAALLEFSPATAVRTEDRSWERHGAAGALEGLEQAQQRFPGLAFESHSRHIGIGQVIEEARVRDLVPAPEPVENDVWPGEDDGEDRDGPVENGNGRTAKPHGRAGTDLALVRDDERTGPPRLNMPVRLTVVHDDQFVHEVTLSYPRALLREALGLHVDTLDKSLSAIQSAFIAPVGSGFTTYRTEAPPVPEVVEASPVVTAPAVGDEPPRRRRLGVPMALAVVAAAAGAFWWVSQGATGSEEPGPQAAAAKHKPKDKPKPSAAVTPSDNSPSPSNSPSPAKTRKPDVTLKSDLAFARDSATLSAAAKLAIADVALQVRRAKLTGTIRVNGYTDSLGSAQHGLELSQQRAGAVANYLRSKLQGVNVTIVPVGHGEADPIASNATEAGRNKNRRVTILLPKPKP